LTRHSCADTDTEELLRERLEQYQRDPAAYARDILGVQWWSAQQQIAAAILQHRRVLVKASHSVGKTHVAAGLINWHFDCFSPSITSPLMSLLPW